MQFVREELVCSPQDETQATWVPRRNRDDCAIRFDATICELQQFFLALIEPYPLPFITIRSQPYEVVEQALLSREYYCTLGRVVHLSEEGAYIKIRDGLLVVKMLRDKDGRLHHPKALLKSGMRLSRP